MIKFVPFDTLKCVGHIPRCPNESRSLLVNFEDTIRDESLYIFMSHCWLRGWDGAPGWDGFPNPDTSNHDKYKLMVASIEIIMNTLTENIKNCYIWIDYSCIDQDLAACDELKILDKIIGTCDLILTNIYDDDSNCRDFLLHTTDTNENSNIYEDYKSPAWNIYLSRGWTRVEMLYAANIPLENDKADRASEKFKAGLLSSINEGRRPHLLYGTKEYIYQNPPIHLPPMVDSWFDKYHPMKGKLTKETDRIKIRYLIKSITPILKNFLVGYIGDRNETGQMHGRGIRKYINGHVYEGEFKNDMRHGFGVMKYVNGDVYTGQFKMDKKNDLYGVKNYANGDIYKGGYEDNYKDGTGEYLYASCSDNKTMYRGEFKNDKRNGIGKFINSDGIYEGEWKNDNFYEGKFKKKKVEIEQIVEYVDKKEESING